MAWDTEATKQQLLDAGARQFAAHGFAGARMDAIGRDAGVNKERVYQYFGNKQGLFGAVLDDRLTNLLLVAGTPGKGAQGVGAFAGSLFDHFSAAPELARLLAWESLEVAPAQSDTHLTPSEICRADSCAGQALALQAALPGVDREAASHLLLSIVALCASWWTLARVGEMIAPGTAQGARRAALVDQVTALAERASAAPYAASKGA